MWLIVCYGMSLVCLFLQLIFVRNYEKEMVRRHVKKGSVMRLLYPLGLWYADLWKKYIRKNRNGEEDEWAQAIYVRDLPEERYRLRCARRALSVWAAAVAGASAGLIFSILISKSSEQEIQEVERPSFGETQEYTLQVEGPWTDAVTVDVEISGKEPEEEQMQRIFDEAFVHVLEASLGENPAWEEVRLDLEPVTVTDYGIRVEWSSPDPAVINSRGEITAEHIPDEGIVTSLFASLSYAAMEAVYEVPVHVYPPVKDEAYYYQLLMGELSQMDQNGRTEAKVRLPESAGGESLRFSTEKTTVPWGMIGLILVIGLLLAAADRQNMKQEYEERNQMLLQEYPTLVFKLSLMLSCGMTLRSAWERITDSYRQENRRELRSRGYLYEEMLVTQTQISAGTGEAAAYPMFGQRCGLDCYLRLGSCLGQNVRQGVAGMSRMLDAEMVQALELRKNQALKAGEALNTKLLMPMMAMLGVVIAVLITPAMLSM
ncbi:MAG: hypothetical protein IJ468_00680 [Lachnospiraceae bacterium]|nr:hypothetical protein [Lachnospiraceae bacterium]